MRLPLIAPETLKGEQRALYDDMKKGIETSFKGFKAIDESGALIGPWNPWLTFPQFGGPVWNYTKALASDPKLPKSVREVAILVTGTHFHSGYELYAHILVGEARGLSDEVIATIVSGEKPSVVNTGQFHCTLKPRVTHSLRSPHSDTSQSPMRPVPFNRCISSALRSWGCVIHPCASITRPRGTRCRCCSAPSASEAAESRTPLPISRAMDSFTIPSKQR